MTQKIKITLFSILLFTSSAQALVLNLKNTDIASEFTITKVWCNAN
jgi:hypothetical protein